VGKNVGTVPCQSWALVLTMHSETCPAHLHFHVVFEQVGSLSRPNKAVTSPTPADALDDFLKLLPEGWRGGVSVYDDEIGHEDEMPILHAYVGAYK